jgi:hypothetical protein
MELERIDSVTNDRPFNPTQMGVDLDQEGNVKFLDVPNMRVLDAGKRGLDQMVADERNPITGRLSQRGLALDQFRRAYLGELDSLDPTGAYAAARASWAGPSASMDAIHSGQAIFKKRPEEVAADVAQLSPGNLEFYKLGAADAIKEKIARTGMGGDEAKRLIGNQYTQQQLRPLFDNQDDFNRFIDGVTAENRMFETRQRLIGGSQTAERLAEDASPEGAAGHALRGTVALAEGAPGAAGLSYIKALGALSRGESPAVNTAAARMLSAADYVYSVERSRWSQSGTGFGERARGITISAVGTSMIRRSRNSRRMAGPPPPISIRRSTIQAGRTIFKNSSSSIRANAHQC